MSNKNVIVASLLLGLVKTCHVTFDIKLCSEILYEIGLELGSSGTRLGDLLHFGKLFKANSNNYFLLQPPTFQAIFAKVSKSFIVLVKSFLGKFYRHLATFYLSHCSEKTFSMSKSSDLISLKKHFFVFVLMMDAGKRQDEKRWKRQKQVAAIPIPMTRQNC